VADDLHHSTFVFELFKLVLLDYLPLDLLDGDCGVFPPSSVHDAVAALRELAVELQVRKVDLIVGFEALRAGHAFWVHQEGLLALDGLADLLLNVGLICASLLEL